MSRRQVRRGVRIRTYQSGRTAVQITFMYRGIRCRETLRIAPTANNLKFAENLKGEIENAIERGSFRYIDYFPDSPRARLFGYAISKVTVKELLEAWLKDVERAYPHSTYRCYKKSCYATLIPALGDHRVSELARDPEPIRNMIREKNATLKTIRNDLTPLRAVFDQAVTDDLMERNPLDKIKVKNLAMHRRSSSYTADPFSLEEIDRVLEIESSWSDYFAFAFFTGLRPSEQYALRWTDVDWQLAIVRISKATVERTEKETKTQAGTRDVDLMPSALNALQRQRSRSAMKSDYVWLNPVTGKPITDYEETSQAFDYLQKRAGLRRRNQYQTRHSYASNLLSGGENIYYVAEQMGHANIEMVMRVYGKWIKASHKRREWVSDFGKREGKE